MKLAFNLLYELLIVKTDPIYLTLTSMYIFIEDPHVYTCLAYIIIDFIILFRILLYLLPLR